MTVVVDLTKKNIFKDKPSAIGKIRRRIHERTVSLRFRGKILRVLRLEISVCNAYIANQFQTTFARGGDSFIR
jgi:hypothetical protein